MNKLFILLAALLFMVITGCSGGSSDPAPTPLSSAKAITVFSLDGTDGTIDEAGKTIAVTKPFGTNVTALVATFTTTGASVKVGSTIQISGTTANDFTSSVAYIVTAADNTTVTYTVTATVALSSAKAITAYSLAGTAGVINEGAKTIAVAKPYGTDVSALVATFTTTGASVKVGATTQVSGTTPNNFTGAVIYTVTAADSSTVDYTVTVTVAASAVNLPKTGQTVCYDAAGSVIACTNTGQDGDLQKGVAWPSPRFTDNGDQTITDNLTGLMWTQNGNAPGPAGCSPGVGKTWQQALDYAACLNTNNYLGHNDWHLPNRNELRSLANYEQSNIITWLNAQGFNNVQSVYWSSTTIVYSTDLAWTITLNSFEGGDDKIFGYCVWPVRAGQSGAVNLPKTGQAVCYDAAGSVISCTNTGQDGDLQKGVAWPSPRFTDNGDQTITDNLTGLMWTKDAAVPGPAGCTPAVTKTWQQGLDYAACLNTNNFLGHNDWRMPNINELVSIFDVPQQYIAGWLNTQGFTNVTNWLYWSSTSRMSNTNTALVLDMIFIGGVTYGYYIYDNKGNSNYIVWPVRGGQ